MKCPDCYNGMRPALFAGPDYPCETCGGQGVITDPHTARAKQEGTSRDAAKTANFRADLERKWVPSVPTVNAVGSFLDRHEQVASWNVGDYGQLNITMVGGANTYDAEALQAELKGLLPVTVPVRILRPNPRHGGQPVAENRFAAVAASKGEQLEASRDEVAPPYDGIRAGELVGTQPQRAKVSTLEPGPYATHTINITDMGNGKFVADIHVSGFHAFRTELTLKA